MRRGLLLVLALAAGAAPGYAQTAPPPGSGAQPPKVEYLSRFDYRVGLERLITDDKRFEWDANFGSDLDIVDFGAGRVGFLANYQAILGSEFREFDPNQANYTLEGSVSAREGSTEIAGVFHHVSRHLSDRPKRFSIAWNVLGARVLRRVEVRGVQVDARVDVDRVVQHSYVDYSWTADADLSIRRVLTPRIGVFTHGYGEVFGVDGTVANRNAQTGGVLEAGVRLNGKAGAIELFAGVERRIDADPADRLPRRWVVAGFRLLSK